MLPHGDPVRAGREYQAAVGRLLRQVRNARGLSLKDVEGKSGGRWAAGRVGAYERGTNAVTVAGLVELAGLYGVPVAALIPPGTVEGTGFRQGWEACRALLTATLDRGHPIAGQMEDEPL